MAARFQREFEDITATYNFDKGHEFEIVIAELLQKLLPTRFGVCRGFVVAQDGKRAGDDVIIYDRTQFPSLRLLGDSLAKKEEIPAEAVVAYIEAKHTLYRGGGKGQSLEKAVQQVAAVKSLTRDAIAPSRLQPRPGFVDALAIGSVEPGWPTSLNPWYGAIWARNLDEGAGRLPASWAALPSTGILPDLVVAGRNFVLPVFAEQGKPGQIRPFLCPSTEARVCVDHDLSFGIAAAHLLSALEWVQLGRMPWESMIAETLQKGSL